MSKMNSGPNSAISTLEAESSSRRRDEYWVPCLTARPKGEAKSKEQVQSQEQIQDSHQSDLNFEKKEALGLAHAWATKLQGVFHKGAKQVYLLTRVDEDEAREYLFTDGDRDVARPDSLPPKLPNEIWLQVMGHLAPGSLWALRLSSPIFFNLFNKSQNFRQFHGVPGLKDRYVRFNLEKMTKLERKEALGMLRRDEPAASNLAKDSRSYCDACSEVLNRGEDHPMMIKLRETRYCDGCKERHLCVFFPPESIDLHDRELLDELLCVGRLGTAALCSHKLAQSLTWKKVEDEAPHAHKSYIPLELTCTEDCHEPLSRDRRGIDESSCPNMSARYSYQEGTIDLKLGWSRPLLDIDPTYPPSVKDIRRALANLLDGAFAQHKPCRHMLDGRQLRTLAFTGICKCFCKPDHLAQREDRPPYLPKNTCSCLRRTYLECRECAASYCWLLRGGRISLSYRYVWTTSQPTSPAWINLLDGGPQGLGMFTEDNKHLVWCDGPECSTGMGRRWEEMLKEAVWLHEIPEHEDLDRYQRWVSLKNAHTESKIRRETHKSVLGGFELDPNLLEYEYSRANKLFLRRIVKAAERAQEEKAQEEKAQEEKAQEEKAQERRQRGKRVEK
jgi:hypothetical protein